MRHATRVWAASWALLFSWTLSTQADVSNLAPQGTATQSSTGWNLGAENAIDGNTGNLTATDPTDMEPSWQVDLSALAPSVDVHRIVVHNRDACCQTRLRDITVSVLETGGEVVAYASDLLNPGDALGGPEFLELDLVALTGGPVAGAIVRVARTPDAVNLAGDDVSVLSLGEVEVFADAGAAPVAIFTQPMGAQLSLGDCYTLSVGLVNAENAESVTFQWYKDDEPIAGATGDALTIEAALDSAGTYHVVVQADDEELTSEPAIIEVTGVNVARLGVATQTTNFPCCGGFPAPLANDGNPGNFTATAPDDPAPTWQVDFGDVADSVPIARIIVHNRDNCCPTRLRDITVSILDGEDVAFTSEPLNPGDVLGDGVAEPQFLELDLVELTGGPVDGTLVRVERTPDPAVAGEPDVIDNDDDSVMSLGEVEVIADTSFSPGESPNLTQRGCDVVASQSTTLAAFGAELAIDGNPGNFTVTGREGPAPTWQVDLGATWEIGTIIVRNRGDGCCPSRLRDITVSVLDAPGGEVVFETELLNPANVMGEGMLNVGPPLLEVDAGGAMGRVVVVARTPDPDNVGTGGEGGVDEAVFMSLGEVEVYEYVPPVACDTHCEGLTITTTPGASPNVRAEAAATDDSGDEILYTFTADDGAGGVVTVGPQPENIAEFDLAPGEHTISVTVGDDTDCDPPAEDITCSEVVVVLPPGVGPFRRGDSNSDSELDLSDASNTLNFLFLGGSAPGCLAAADANSDGAVDLSDAVYSLEFLFLGGPAPVAPFESCARSSRSEDEALGCDAPSCEEL